LIFSSLSYAQTGSISTYAGNGSLVFSGDSGPATNASIYQPYGLAVDAIGNLYVADSGHSRIRRVDVSTGIITTAAGTGVFGYSGDGGPATAAQLGTPYDVKLDAPGNLFICDANDHHVRRVDSGTGIITTVAGTGAMGLCGSSTSSGNSVNLIASGLAIDLAGNIYVGDVVSHQIHRIDAVSGVVTTIAGIGVAGFSGDGGPAVSAALNTPAALAFDSSGNLYVSDGQNYRVRKIDAVTGIITTVVGNGTSTFNGDGIPATGASLGFPGQLAFDPSGNLIFADATNYRVRMVDASTGLVWTIAGSGRPPNQSGTIGDGGPALSAQLNLPVGLAMSSSTGALFVAEWSSERVRRVSLPGGIAGTATTLSANVASVQTGDPITLTASLSAINGLAANATRGFFFIELPANTLLGQGLIANGAASLTTSFSATGNHTIYAQYVGDSTFGVSSSPTLIVNSIFSLKNEPGGESEAIRRQASFLCVGF
jgi:trimeric autotransporter adhesin